LTCSFGFSLTDYCMLKIYVILMMCCLVVSGSAQTWNAKPTEKQIQTHLEWVKQELKKPESKNVLVAAHRGDWRNAPENSIQGLVCCINMGVDIVEMDLKKTKDGCLILMHDKTINRTTNGKGFPEDMTLDSLRTFFLKSGITGNTKHKIPTFEEYMLAAKGKMFICVDKSYPYLKDVVQVLKKTGTLDQVLLNGEKSLTENLKDYGDLIKQINFKPIVHTNEPRYIEEYLVDFHPAVMELVYATDSSKYIQNSQLIKSKGVKIWHNALWAELCAGHIDDIAVEQNRPQESWGWIINHGATIIQTDRPQLLLNYLRENKLHM